MTSALAIYASALRSADRGGHGRLRLLGPTGRALRHLDARSWHSELSPADRSVLLRCHGPTLDIGCGPGRFVAALRRAGVDALGIDVSPAAIRIARQVGARAVLADVFGPLPGDGVQPGRGMWRHALLADGNIGIGGDPTRLLRRCANLLSPRGTIIVEVEPPGTPTWSGHVSISDERRVSEAFQWALVGADQLPALAEDADLHVVEAWTGERRWFACLAC